MYRVRENEEAEGGKLYRQRCLVKSVEARGRHRDLSLGSSRKFTFGTSATSKSSCYEGETTYLLTQSGSKCSDLG
jgi:hypothetical protein